MEAAYAGASGSGVRLDSEPISTISPRLRRALGFFYWAAQYANGMSLVDIAKNFFNSAEAVAARPQGQSLSDMVSHEYTDVLEHRTLMLTRWRNRNVGRSSNTGLA